MNPGIDALLSEPPAVTRTARGPIEHVTLGTGKPLLALHGGMGGRDQGLILARALIGDIRDYHIIAVSRPGYLGTPQASGVSPEEQADLYAALLDTLGIERVTVAAVSAGGPSAVEFALRHPDRCEALILVSCCTGHLAIPDEVKKRLPVMQWFARFEWLSTFMRWRVRRDPVRAAGRAIADPVIRDRTLAHPVAGHLLAALQQSPFSDLRDRLPGTLNDMDEFEKLTTLPFEQVRVPVLAIHGTADRIVPFAHGERAMRAPAGELMAIEGGEHVAIFTDLDAIGERVRQFLSRLS